MGTITQLLNHARSELGTREGPNNHTEYAREAGHADNQPWCATFLVAMFRRNGMKLGNESAYTPSLAQSLKDQGCQISGPRRGCVVFYYFDSMGRIAHTGVVEAVRSDGTFETIEGNTDVAGGRTGGQVMRKLRSQYKTSFFMPKGYTTKPLTRLQKLQRALETDRDNIWGPDTERRALNMRAAGRTHLGRPNIRRDFNEKLVQSIVDVQQDGIWGPRTRSAFVGWLKGFQNFLGVRQTGYWDTATDRAFLAFRKRYHR